MSKVILCRISHHDPFEFTGYAAGASADGTVVVGSSQSGQPTEFAYGWEAVIWFGNTGWEIISLNDFLDNEGVDRNGFVLSQAYAISYDGTTIVGAGQHTNENREAFRVRIVDLWGPYTVSDGNADTGDWMRRVYVADTPWIWSYSLNTWLFCPEGNVSETGGWVYFRRLLSALVQAIDLESGKTLTTINTKIYNISEGRR